MSQWNYLRLEIGILYSLLRQWNGSEDNNMTSFSNIVIKFAVVFNSRTAIAGAIIGLL